MKIILAILTTLLFAGDVKFQSSFLYNGESDSRMDHQMGEEVSTVKYLVTNRGKELVCAEHMIDSTELINYFQGRRVLDMGAGHGEFVKNLLSQGIDAYGLDLIETSSWNKDENLKNRFYRADMSNTNLPDESFDDLISTFSIFWYYPTVGHESTRFYRYPKIQRTLFYNTLKEAHRILRTEGTYFIAPISNNVKNLLVEYAEQMQFDILLGENKGYYSLQLRKR